MKVILLKDVGGVGQRNALKDTADGYALNFLIPRGLAVQATPEKIAQLERQLAEETKSSAEKHAGLAAQIKAADGKKIVVRLKANEQGHLFKGVKKDDVARELANVFGALIDADSVVGALPVIKETGEYLIHLAGAGAEAAVTFVVKAAN